MNTFFRDILTENDAITYDAVRVLAVLAIIVALGLAVFVVVVKNQPFSVQDFGIGIGAVFLSVGGALKLKSDAPASTVATRTTTVIAQTVPAP